MAAKWSSAQVIKTSPENTKNAPNENERQSLTDDAQ